MRQRYFGAILLAVLLVITSCSQHARNPQTDALIQAAREGKADTVKALLSGQGVDVNATDNNGNTALLEAARFGHDDVVRVLLTAGANIKARDKQGKTALMLAVQGGHDDVVRALKQAGATE